MEAVNKSTKIKYPCQAKVTYIGEEGITYTPNTEYLVNIYKVGGRKGKICIAIAGNEDSEWKYTSEHMLKRYFKINEVIEEKKDENAFTLTISKKGQVSYKHSEDADTTKIIAALSVVHGTYVLGAINPPK